MLDLSTRRPCTDVRVLQTELQQRCRSHGCPGNQIGVFSRKEFNPSERATAEEYLMPS